MSRETLKRIFDVSEDLEKIDDKPLDEVMADLKSAGLDPSRLIKFAHQKMAARRAAAKLDKAREERARLLALRERARTVERRSATTRPEVLTLIRELATNSPELAQAFHRKFENATDDDLESILDDIAFLDAADKEPDGSST